MRRLVLLSVVALIALTEACAVGPGYRRSSLGMPDGWRPPATSEDSLRPFFDSLRTSRDTLLPPGADTARVPFVYDTAPRGRGDSAVALRWLDLVQDSVLRQLVDTSLRQNRDVRTALAVIDEFRAQYRATRGGLRPELGARSLGPAPPRHERCALGPRGAGGRSPRAAIVADRRRGDGVLRPAGGRLEPRDRAVQVGRGGGS